jgi:hypothetical protein
MYWIELSFNDVDLRKKKWRKKKKPGREQLRIPKLGSLDE